MNMFGSKKATAEPYKSDMPLLDEKNQIVVSFDELDGGTDNKYKGKYKITAKKGDVTSEYVVDPNDKSVNKAVVEAIVSELNGGEEKVTDPTDPTDPTEPPVLSAELTALNAVVDELVAGIADAAIITSATAKISDAIEAIPEADKSTALAKVEAALKKVNDAIAAVPTPPDPLQTALQTALKSLEAALKSLEAATPEGGYNSAKSAVPKRITRIRRTRRSAKRAGTRRRLTR